MSISRSRLPQNMASISLRSSLRILWTATSVLVYLTRSSAAPTFRGRDKTMKYLAQYGYLSPMNPPSGQINDESLWRQAIAEFQSFAGLNATGELDEETEQIMLLPRCGVKDKTDFEKSRAKRYMLLGIKWQSQNLIYKISKYPSERTKLNRDQVDAIVAKAFSVWSDYTYLTFTQIRFGQFHIDIRFEEGDHGDGSPFDGPGGTLAHANGYGGYVHFDDGEIWSITEGKNLFQVAAHEFGHALGLGHSDVQSALMFPFYRGYNPAFKLHQDDIRGIQALYGKKTQRYPDAKLFGGTIFTFPDGRTSVFKGRQRRPIKNGVAWRAWLGLPWNIDVAVDPSN